ncbi:MAG: oligosaccharide flippase family protein [Pseudomonadota bacterium]
MRFLSRFFNIRGELFSSTMTYGLSALIKLGSSLVLTRLLDPEAYGVIGILFSVAFTLELLSDVGTMGLLIRHARGNERRFVHTLWTVRLIRSGINFALLYALAPVIARIYELPILIDALRLFSLWFVLVGLESMAFIVAQRNQRSRIGNYIDLAASAVMTVFVIALASVVNDYKVFIYGSLLQKAITVVASHFFYREVGVGFAFDREAVKDQFHFGKFVLPSSLLTIVLTQYDKVVLLKLFDLTTLGIYGLAGNMIGPVAGMINHNCRVVLYPRCAEYFRSSRATAAHRYYAENARLLTVVTLPPMVIAGFSQTIVALLYDSRYQGASTILMVFGLSAFIGALQGASENVLVASGRTGIVLGANIVRLLTIVPFTLLGFHLFGFQGFIWVGLLAGFPVLFYYYREQRRDGLLEWRAELRRFAAGLAVFAVSLLISSSIVGHIPPDLLRHLLHIPSRGAH